MFQFSSEEELRQSFNTGDKAKDAEIINAYLTGQVVVGEQAQQSAEEQSTQEHQVNDNVEQSQIDASAAEEVKIVEARRKYEEELEKQRNYASLLEKQRQEEQQEYLRKLDEINRQKEAEKIAREESEKRLQQLQSLSTSSTVNADGTTDDEEEYASSYNKQTREMLLKLQEQYGANNEVVKRMAAEFENSKRERERLDAEERQRKAEQKLYDSISSLQSSYSELKTEKPLTEVRQDYRKFRNDIGMLVGAKTPAEIDKAVNEYLRGGAIAATAGKYGIAPPKDYEKYNTIVELIDMKNGVQYDPVLGKEIPILDDFGGQVRYRSLEEAYRIKTDADRIAKAKRDAFDTVAQKMNEFKNSAVTLGDRTDAVTVGLTAEQEREVINWKPEVWMNDTEKKKLVEQVYLKYGMEMPRYRGRKF